MNVPIAEHFHSVQGEGLYTGVPMHFIRLAGCTVGKYIAALSTDTEPNIIPILKTGKSAWKCHAYDGTPFWCDTDFHKYDTLTVDELMKMTTEGHICLTGGEPLMHLDIVREIIISAAERDIMVHIETSGTIPFPRVWYDYAWFGANTWVTVAPKQNYIDDMLIRADELKILVDEFFDIKNLPAPVWKHELVYIQPINYEMSVRQESLDRVLKLLGEHPEWRLSVQLHKLIGQR